MKPARSPILKLWRQVGARPRLLSSIVAGTCAFFLLPDQLTASFRALVVWDIGAGLYLLLAWVMMSHASLEHMRWRAGIEDDSAATVLFLTVAAAIASLAAIILELSGLKSDSLIEQSQHLVLVGLTFLASWLLVHTSFALHYAHAYYVSLSRDGGPPLQFPDQDAPVYMDFLYFSTVIGMTSQTADVAVASTPMRRLVMAQGMIAFLFNTTLLALTINIAASLLG